MAGKAKSCYLSVVIRETQKAVLRKVFFEAKSMNDFVKTDEFLEKYPAITFQIVKETY